jgi:hypothetical protein
MTTDLTDRLNQILPHVTSKAFLSSEGIGNEIACYIFDYPADEELQVREHLGWMMKRFESHYKDLRVLHLDLLDVVVKYLDNRGIFEKALKMQQTKGDAAVLKALRGPLTAEKLRDAIAADYNPGGYDLVMISGVGSVWPMMRAHGLLNSLHTVMDQTPLVMFYPGSFDGTTLKLFGLIDAGTRSPESKHYYRAFSLIPRETQS